MIRTTYFSLFYILIASNSTECMIPKMHQTNFPNNRNNINVNTTMEFLSIPGDVIFTHIIQRLERANQLTLKETCKTLYDMISFPEFSNLILDLEVVSTIDTPKLKSTRTFFIMSLLEKNYLTRVRSKFTD